MSLISRKAVMYVWVLLGVLGGMGELMADNSGRMSFKEDVEPILKYRCVECHTNGGSGVTTSGLLMDSYEDLMKGTQFGPVIVPGNAMVSNLNVLVEGRAGIRMPHNRKRLTPCEIQILRDWVNQGARNN